MNVRRKTLLVAITLVALGLAAGGSLGAAAPTVTISDRELSVSISRTGAELQSIRHVPTDIEYLWQGDPKYWAARSPNMFPVCVRFKGDRFTYEGKSFEMPRLGIAVGAPFDLENENAPTASARRVCLILNSSATTLRHYPFSFQLKIDFEVSGLTLTQTYKVSNTGSKTLYFALGGHPGLQAPLSPGRHRSDYEIRFSKTLNVDREIITGGLWSGRRVPFLHHEDRLALDDPRISDSGLFLENHPSRQISVALKGRSPYVTVDLGDFPNTNLWTPPGMPYVCVEPMVGHHDRESSPEAIESKDQLVRLPPGEGRSYQYSIRIDPAEGVRALHR